MKVLMVNSLFIFSSFLILFVLLATLQQNDYYVEGLPNLSLLDQQTNKQKTAEQTSEETTKVGNSKSSTETKNGDHIIATNRLIHHHRDHENHDKRKKRNQERHQEQQNDDDHDNPISLPNHVPNLSAFQPYQKHDKLVKNQNAEDQGMAFSKSNILAPNPASYVQENLATYFPPTSPFALLLTYPVKIPSFSDLSETDQLLRQYHGLATEFWKKFFTQASQFLPIQHWIQYHLYHDFHFRQYQYYSHLIKEHETNLEITQYLNQAFEAFNSYFVNDNQQQRRIQGQFREEGDISETDSSESFSNNFKPLKSKEKRIYEPPIPMSLHPSSSSSANSESTLTDQSTTASTSVSRVTHREPQNIDNSIVEDAHSHESSMVEESATFDSKYSNSDELLSETESDEVNSPGIPFNFWDKYFKNNHIKGVQKIDSKRSTNRNSILTKRGNKRKATSSTKKKLENTKKSKHQNENDARVLVVDDEVINSPNDSHAPDQEVSKATENTFEDIDQAPELGIPAMSLAELHLDAYEDYFKELGEYERPRFGFLHSKQMVNQKRRQLQREQAEAHQEHMETDEPIAKKPTSPDTAQSEAALLLSDLKTETNARISPSSGNMVPTALYDLSSFKQVNHARLMFLHSAFQVVWFILKEIELFEIRGDIEAYRDYVLEFNQAVMNAKVTQERLQSKFKDHVHVIRKKSEIHSDIAFKFRHSAHVLKRPLPSVLKKSEISELLKQVVVPLEYLMQLVSIELYEHRENPLILEANGLVRDVGTAAYFLMDVILSPIPNFTKIQYGYYFCLYVNELGQKFNQLS